MKIYSIFFLISIGFFSCKGDKDSTDGTELKTDILESQLDSLYTQYYPEDGPAAAVMITYDGHEVFKKTYGLRNLDTRQKADTKTNFRSGSLAKQFTALAILSLVEEGKINLSDTIYNYIPYPILRNVTISQLISHTSGIEDAEWVLEKDWNSSTYIKMADIMNWYANNEVSRFAPGTQFEYNNATYYLLVRLVEEKSEMSFADYVKMVVFDKVGMKNSYFVNEQNINNIPHMATTYERDSLGNWVTDSKPYPDILVGPGGLYSNLDDYSRYLKALRNHQIIDDSAHQLIFKPISMNTELHSEDMRMLKGAQSSYAMGWETFDSLAVSAGLYYGVNNWCVLEFKRPLTLLIFTSSNTLFKEKVVEKTYKMIDDFYKVNTENGY